MPPQLQALLQDRRILLVTALVLVLLIGVGIFFNPFGGGGANPDNPPLDREQMDLVSTKNLGKAIEIQALLAREGLRLDRAQDEQDFILRFRSGATQQDRDRALITLVQSGLMDRNVGLEAFDKGDLTASREEKRIKLIRAQQGELARLIRKIDPIEDASVSLSIPEQTLFRSEEKPLSASVQVTMPTGQTLTRDKVRSIINLIVGSVQGLDSHHVALADTAGNVYNSVLDVGSELNDKLEQQDLYMKQKVAAQLEKLVGSGNYVVTVSTMLREAPKEMMVQTFDPQHSTVLSKQTFSENLNTNSGMGGGGPVSSMLPPGASGSTSQSANKDYVRSGTEVSYANAKTQWIETSMPGMIEDISIAVTIDRSTFPDMPLEELQRLIAHSASPKVRAESVSIARASFNKAMPGMIETVSPGEMDEEGNMGWIIWALGAVGACFLAVMILSLGRGSGKPNNEGIEETQREIQYLRDLADQQQAQLQATQQQTQMLLEAQKHQPLPQQEAPKQIAEQGSQLQQTLQELQEAVNSGDLEDEDLELQIKSWIESS